MEESLRFKLFWSSKSWHPPLFVAKCHVMNVVCELAEDISRRKEPGLKRHQVRVSSFEQLVRRRNMKYFLKSEISTYFLTHLTKR